MKTIKVGILGLGTVGGGTALVLQRNANEITRRTGAHVDVTVASVRDLNGERLCDCSKLALTIDPYEIVNSADIDIVVELIGGDTLAKELVLIAIANGKHVVTANKALIALHGNEIFAAAEAKDVSVLYESAVAGGISIIKSMREGLAGNQIEMVAGIINGTGNFILTEMRDKGRTFEDVLAEAQALGYAEADPTFDVEGIDAAHKLTILASIAFGIPLDFSQLYTQGISGLSLIDVAFAEELGYRIKHLGIAKKTDSGIELRVHPIVDLVRTIDAPAQSRVPHLGFQSGDIAQTSIKNISEVESVYYLRVEVNDVAGVMSKLSTCFAELDVSIEGITQKEPLKGEHSVSIIFITQRTMEKRIDLAIEQIQAMNDVHGDVVKIRVEHLD